MMCDHGCESNCDSDCDSCTDTRCLPLPSLSSLVKLSATATSDTIFHPTFPASQCVDGTLDNLCLSLDDNWPSDPYLTLDLGTAIQIAYVAVYPVEAPLKGYPSLRVPLGDYKVNWRTTESDEWTACSPVELTAAEGAIGPLLSECPLVQLPCTGRPCQPVRAQYVMIKLPGSARTLSLAEVEVYSLPSSPPLPSPPPPSPPPPPPSPQPPPPSLPSPPPPSPSSPSPPPPRSPPQCCDTIRIDMNGDTSISQGSRAGEYVKTSTTGGRAVYSQTSGSNHLFFYPSSSCKWRVGTDSSDFSAMLTNCGKLTNSAQCPEAEGASWKYFECSGTFNVCRWLSGDVAVKCLRSQMPPLSPSPSPPPPPPPPPSPPPPPPPQCACDTISIVLREDVPHQHRAGEYVKTSTTQGGRAVYSQTSGSNYLFFWADYGKWRVGTNYRSSSAGLISPSPAGNTQCPEAEGDSWQYFGSGKWTSGGVEVKCPPAPRFACGPGTEGSATSDECEIVCADPPPTGTSRRALEDSSAARSIIRGIEAFLKQHPPAPLSSASDWQKEMQKALSEDQDFRQPASA